MPRFKALTESVLCHANVKAIYGEPISAQEKTIIPVAKIMYGYVLVQGTGGIGEKNAHGPPHSPGSLTYF